MSGLFSATLFAGSTALVVNAQPWCGPLITALKRGGCAVAASGVGANAADLDVSADLTEAPGVTRAFDDVEAALGPVSILVTGPAPRRPAPATLMRHDDWKRTMAPAYDATFFCAGEFARRRIATGRGGAIVALLETPEAGAVASTAAAAGVANLVRTLGVEWAREGIRVNGLSAADWDQAHGDTLATMVLYLCSPYAGFVTSSLLTVSGAVFPPDPPPPAPSCQQDVRSSPDADHRSS